MKKITLFNFMSLDGYYKGNANDISWHPHGNEEEHEFALEGAKSGSTLLFGRITYDMMAAFWPSSAATGSDPEMAKGMNEAEKIVFSRTLKDATWKNTKIVSGNMVEELRALKKQPGNNMTLLGSGTIATQLATAGLIDEYQLLLDPVVIGSGTSILRGIDKQLSLELTKTRTFKSGSILLCYQPL